MCVCVCVCVCVCIPHTQIHQNVRPALSGHSI